MTVSFTSIALTATSQEDTMNKHLTSIVYQISFFAILLFTVQSLLISASAQVAIKGETVYTMEGQPIKNGVVLTAGGKITAVGPTSSISIPTSFKVIEAKVVTPGLIDAHTVIGLAGYLNQPHDQMQIERSSPMQPDLRAIDSYNAREELIEWVRSLGVTTIHTGHAPLALISGQTMIAKTSGDSVDEATIVPTAMIATTIGNSANATGGKAPGTTAKQAAMLRQMLIKAQNYGKKKEFSRDLKLEMMKKVIDREIPLLVTAHRARDIMTALRIAKEFKIKIVLDGVSEAHLVMNEIKASGFPVIIHATMMRAGGDSKAASMTTASKLKRAGIPVAIQSGYEGYVPKTRVVLFEAAVTVAYGMSMQDALSTITIDAAKILGLDNRIGSIKVGKDADLAMYDGDPFEYTTHCVGTMVNGKVVSTVVR